MMSHLSDRGSAACAFINLPVKSFNDQRVITMTIDPPGCKR